MKLSISVERPSHLRSPLIAVQRSVAVGRQHVVRDGPRLGVVGIEGEGPHASLRMENANHAALRGKHSLFAAYQPDLILPVGPRPPCVLLACTRGSRWLGRSCSSLLFAAWWLRRPRAACWRGQRWANEVQTKGVPVPSAS